MQERQLFTSIAALVSALLMADNTFAQIGGRLLNQPLPVVNQPLPVVNQPLPVVNQPLLNQPLPVVNQPLPVVNQPLLNQLLPVVNQPLPVVNQPLLNQPLPVVNQLLPIVNQLLISPINASVSFFTAGSEPLRVSATDRSVAAQEEPLRKRIDQLPTCR